MRLRTFTGPTLSGVMAKVRQELGPDAVILSSADAPGGGVEVRAAAERGAVAPSGEQAETAVARRATERARARGDASEGLSRIAKALHWHEISEDAARAIVDAAMQLEDGAATATLARALDQRYGVHPVEADPGRPILFAGPPGAGKSSAIAKLAARAVNDGARPALVTCDARSGAREQMTAYADALDLTLDCVDGPRELSMVVSKLPAGPVLIDTAGINPFDLDDLDDLSDLAAAADAEIVAVLEAGISAGDAEDAGGLMAAAGAGRVIITKLDAARRRGAVIGYGEAGLAYAHISASPYIGAGLAPATGLRLARALLEDADLEEA
jgi:flagellar biosynthesis protein FlhF